MIVADLSIPRDQVDDDPESQNVGESATSSVQIRTMNSNKQRECGSIEEASSVPGLNEDSTEQTGPETLPDTTFSKAGYDMSMSEHGKDLLSEEIRASIRSLEERMKQLENGKARLPGSKIDSRAPKGSGRFLDRPSSEDPEKRIRAPNRIIPQRKYVGWHEFKNKFANEEDAYAIEVLVGGAKLYHQRVEEVMKDEEIGGIHGQDQPAKLSMKLDDELRTSEASTPKEVPERIRINSTTLISILKQIDPKGQWSEPIVILRPFKCLVYYDAQLRERYHRLEAKWGAYEPEVALGQGGPGVAKAADQLRDEAETNKPSDSPLMAKEGESLQDQTIESSTAERESPSGKVLGLSKEVPTEDKEEHCLEDSCVENTSHSTIELGVSSHGDKPVRNEEAQNSTESKVQTDSVEAFRELRCLIGFIDHELKPVMEDFKAGRRKKVYFSELWYLFRPGDLLYTPLGNKADIDVARALDTPVSFVRKMGARFQEVWRIDATTDGRPNLREPPDKDSLNKKVNSFLLHGYHTDINYVQAFDTFMYLFRIDSFPGQRDISSLPFYPLKYLDNADHLCSKWKARGEAFREFHTFVHKYYVGRSLTSYPNGDVPPDDNFPKHAENIDSQVVIDFGEGFAANPGWQTHEELDPPIGYATSEFEEDYSTNFWMDMGRKELYRSVNEYIYQDWHIDTKLSDEQRLHDKLMGNRRTTFLTEFSQLSDEHIILLPNRVFAFVLRNRKFGNVPKH